MAAFKQRHRLGLERAELADLPGRHPAVDLRALGAEPLGLAGAGLEHLGQQVGRGRAGGHLGQLGEGDGGDLDVEVDPVEQGAGDPAQVLLDLRRRAATGAPRVGAIAARAGIHRGHQDELGGERRAPQGPADRHLAFLQRLAEDFQRLAIELGHLVQEQARPCGPG